MLLRRSQNPFRLGQGCKFFSRSEHFEVQSTSLMLAESFEWHADVNRD